MTRRKGELSIADLRGIVRFVRVGNQEYWKPTMNSRFKELIGSLQAGTTFQWNYEMINDVPKITIELNPKSEPSILDRLNQDKMRRS